MVTSECETEIQVNAGCHTSYRATDLHVSCVASSGHFPDEEKIPLFPAVMAARALAEAFGIENAVLLPATVTRR